MQAAASKGGPSRLLAFTATAAWVYPTQKATWHLVSAGKLGAWFLLMINSYALVAAVHGIERFQPDQD